jgi:hypothetical protein
LECFLERTFCDGALFKNIGLFLNTPHNMICVTFSTHAEKLMVVGAVTGVGVWIGQWKINMKGPTGSFAACYSKGKSAQPAEVG